MIVRRLLILVAVLLALTAFAVAADTDGGGQDSPAVATPSPSPTADAGAPSPAERDTSPANEPPVRTLRAEDAGQVVRVRPGQRVRLRVVADELETVQLGVDGPIEVVEPDSPAQFEVLAEPGLDADVRLLESGRTIGRLTTGD